MSGEAGGGAEVVSPAAQAARDEITAIKSNPSRLPGYGEGDTAAIGHMTRLHQTAFGEGAPTLAPVEAARARIAELVGSPEFAAKLAAGDATARSEMERLHREAHPETGTPDPHAGLVDGEYEILPIHFDPGASVETMAEANGIVVEAARTLGFDPAFTRGAVETLAESVTARGTKPMTGDELGRMEDLLRERLGDQYDARMDVLEAAFRKLGPKAGVALQQNIRHCDPAIAAWAIMTLSDPRK